jgi:hypothetical protein
MRLTVLLVLGLTLVPISANAQAPAMPDKPIIWLGMQRGGPQRIAGEVTWMRPFGKAETDDNLKRQKAIVIQGAGGLGGFRVGAGLGLFTGPFGPDALVTLTRTTSRARGATPGATYVGFDAGYRWLFIRPAVSVSYRLSDQGSREDRVVVSGGFSITVPICRR